VFPTFIIVPTEILGVVQTTDVNAFGIIVRSFEVIVAPFEESIKYPVKVFVKIKKLLALIVLVDSAFLTPVTLNVKSDPAAHPEVHLLLIVIA